MNTESKPVPSIIRPGKAPEGPPGWEQRRIEKQIQEEKAQERRNHRRESSTGMAGIKEKVHKIGEKMHLVEPKDPSLRTAAQFQVKFQPSSPPPFGLVRSFTQKSGKRD